MRRPRDARVGAIAPCGRSPCLNSTYIRLSSHQAAFCIDWRLVSDGRMQTLAVVEAFNPIDDFRARFCPCGIALRMDQLDLQGFEEAFRRGVALA